MTPTSSNFRSKPCNHKVFCIDFFVGLFSSGFGRSLKIPRRNNRAGLCPKLRRLIQNVTAPGSVKEPGAVPEGKRGLAKGYDTAGSFAGGSCRCWIPAVHTVAAVPIAPHGSGCAGLLLPVRQRWCGPESQR